MEPTQQQPEPTQPQPTQPMQPKNKKGVWILVILIILVVLIAIFLAIREANTDPSDLAVTVEDALAGSGSVRCTFNEDETGASGVLYVKDGVIRSDIDNADGITNSVIVNPEQVYFWQEGDPQGFIYANPGNQGDPSAPTGSLPTREQIEASLRSQNVDCDAALLSNSYFTPPSDVTFIPFEQAAGSN